MNKKIRLAGRAIVVLFAAVSLLCLTSCQIDTLDEPDGIVSGTIRDALNPGGTFWTEQPGGFEIECAEISWEGDENTTLGGQTFQGKADGTFYNCRVFAATYRIIPRNGAFHSAKAQRVEVQAGKEPNLVFDVIPYCSFHDVSIEKDPVTAGTIVVKFNVTTNSAPDDPLTEAIDSIPATIRNWRLFATSRTPYVGANVFDADVSLSDQPLTVADLGKTITYSRSGFKAGTTYYIRLGVRCVESTSDRYNMTEIVKMEF